MAYTFLHHGGARMSQESQQTRHAKKMFNSFHPLSLPSCVLVIFVDDIKHIYLQRCLCSFHALDISELYDR